MVPKFLKVKTFTVPSEGFFRKLALNFDDYDPFVALVRVQISLRAILFRQIVVLDLLMVIGAPIHVYPPTPTRQ